MAKAFFIHHLLRWRPRLVAQLSWSLLVGGCLASCTSSSYPPFGQPNGLRLSDDRSEIIMTGSMRDGLAAEVKHLLDANPAISAIKLESPGGSGKEGYELALLVKEHHLATFSATLCASACTFVYMAGEPRYFAVNGKLGFHSTSVNGVKSEEGNKFSQMLYQEAGVPQSFIDRTLATAPSDIWFPTTEELIKARIVTNLVPDQYFLPSSRTYWASEAELDRALKSQTVIAAVARLDPASYAKIRGFFLDGARQKRGIAQMGAASRNYISNELLPSYYRRAPDDLLIRYLSLQLEAVRYIEQNAPGMCVTALAPTASIAEFSDTHLSPELKNKLDRAMADIIAAALLRPDHVEDDLVNRRIYTEFEKTTLTNSPAIVKTVAALKQDTHNQLFYCRVIEVVEQTVLDQPPVRAAQIIRAQQLKSAQDEANNLAPSH